MLADARRNSLTRSVLVAGALVLGVTCAPQQAAATLIGDSITGCLGNSVSCTQNWFLSPPVVALANATITNPGVEFSGSISSISGDDSVSADFGGPDGTTLLITFRHPAQDRRLWHGDLPGYSALVDLSRRTRRVAHLRHGATVNVANMPSW